AHAEAMRLTRGAHEDASRIRRTASDEAQRTVRQASDEAATLRQRAQQQHATVLRDAEERKSQLLAEIRQLEQQFAGVAERMQSILARPTPPTSGSAPSHRPRRATEAQAPARPSIEPRATYVEQAAPPAPITRAP